MILNSFFVIATTVLGIQEYISCKVASQDDKVLALGNESHTSY
jgi:hypothetical protein